MKRLVTAGFHICDLKFSLCLSSETYYILTFSKVKCCKSKGLDLNHNTLTARPLTSHFITPQATTIISVVNHIQITEHHYNVLSLHSWPSDELITGSKPHSQINICNYSNRSHPIQYCDIVVIKSTICEPYRGDPLTKKTLFN